MSLPTPLLAWTPETTWAVPFVGAAACGLAYLLGRRFLLAPPSEAGEDTAGLAEGLRGVSGERRATPRRRGHSVEVVLADEAGREVGGWVVDRSLGGLCLVVDEPVPEGAPRKVRPRAARESTPWVEVTV